MYLRYRNHNHAAGECRVEIGRQGLRSEHGVLYAIRETWTITGMLTSGSPAALTAAITALESAYSQDSGDLLLYEDSGSVTAHSLLSSATLGGTRVVQRPAFPVGAGAEYATLRTYTAIVEGDRDVGAGLLTYNESITFSGGGVDWGFLPVINGVPPKQIFRQQTPCKAVQTGHATHLTHYPTPPAPIWPNAEHITQRQISKHAPTRIGFGGVVQFTGFGVQWTYNFEDVSQFSGSPHVWG